jgi:DNA (cytosine-5)-methyltransferase 1
MASRGNRAPRYVTGELFCGAGGLSRGFHDIGFFAKFANDIWDTALHAFLMNFDKKYAASAGRHEGEIAVFRGSVENIDANEVLKSIAAPGRSRAMKVGELDVLLGGPPCQGFSLNSHTRSAEDPRNHLFRHYIRLLQGLAPKVFVLENVPGMLSLEGGDFFHELVTTIGKPVSRQCPDYDIDFKILNAAHYGVPQERFRIVVVGTRRDIADEVGKVSLPEPIHYSLAQAHFKGGRAHTFHYAIGHGSHNGQEVIPLIPSRLLKHVTIEEALGDLPKLANGGGEDVGQWPSGKSASRHLSAYQKLMRRSGKALMNHWCRELMPPNTERVKHIPAGGDWRSIPRELLPPGMQRALRKDHTTRYGRLSPDGISGTLLTKPDPHWGTFLHYDVEQQRLISVREAARLQSFPDNHVFYGSQADQYRLCGNAVPPLMAQAVAAKVKQVLDRYHGVSERESVERVPARARA